MKRWILLVFCTTVAMAIHAQKRLNISDFFDGKDIDKSSVTETFIQGDQLKPYHLTSFHSVKFNTSEKERDYLEKDFYGYMMRNAVKTAGGKSNCEMESRSGHLYYAIVEVKPSSPFDQRFISYQCSTTPRGTCDITLVCLEGHVSLQDLRKMFKKK